MSGYAVTIRAGIEPALDDRQLAVVHNEAGGTIAYNSGTGILRYSISTPDPDAAWTQVLSWSFDTIARAVRLAGAAITTVRESRVLDYDDFEAETFRPSTPRGGLAGVAEAAEILGVSTARVHQLRKDHKDFPRPVADLKGGPVWDKAEVEAWERGWDRKRTGRPRKTE